MIDLPSRISRKMWSEILRKMFLLEEGLRLVSNNKKIVIPYDVNLESFRNIEDIDDGSEARILEIIAALSCRIAGMVHFQSFTLA